MIRALLKRDLGAVKTIHEKFYGKEFDLTELNRFICSFVSVDVNDRPIVAGGIKTVVEAMIVTDQDASIESRVDALKEWLITAKRSTSDAGYDQMFAFVQDDKWMRHLMKYGFIPTAGKGLVTGVSI